MGWLSKAKKAARRAKKKAKAAAKAVKKATSGRVAATIDTVASTYVETYGGPYGMAASALWHGKGNPKKAFDYGKDRVEERWGAWKKFSSGDWGGLASDVLGTASKRTGGSAKEQRTLASIGKVAGAAYGKGGGSDMDFDSLMKQAKDALGSDTGKLVRSGLSSLGKLSKGNRTSKSGHAAASSAEVMMGTGSNAPGRQGIVIAGQTFSPVMLAVLVLGGFIVLRKI